jgi:hypothetical protein
MKTTKNLTPLCWVLLLGLLALNPLIGNKNRPLELKFYNELELESSQSKESDDPREGGLLRYKFFVKEKENPLHLSTLKRQNQVLAKYEGKNTQP